MSIVIRGIKLPTSCQTCPLKVNCTDCESLECICVPLHQQIGYWEDLLPDKRRDDCPLGPVPPHGRLIESVELYGRAEDIKAKAMSVYDKPQSWQFGVFWAIEQIEAALTNAPTIIPAEENRNDD